MFKMFSTPQGDELRVIHRAHYITQQFSTRIKTLQVSYDHPQQFEASLNVQLHSDMFNLLNFTYNHKGEKACTQILTISLLSPQDIHIAFIKEADDSRNVFDYTMSFSSLRIKLLTEQLLNIISVKQETGIDTLIEQSKKLMLQLAGITAKGIRSLDSHERNVDVLHLITQTFKEEADRFMGVIADQSLSASVFQP